MSIANRLIRTRLRVSLDKYLPRSPRRATVARASGLPVRRHLRIFPAFPQLPLARLHFRAKTRTSRHLRHLISTPWTWTTTMRALPRQLNPPVNQQYRSRNPPIRISRRRRHQRQASPWLLSSRRPSSSGRGVRAGTRARTGWPAARAAYATMARSECLSATASLGWFQPLPQYSDQHVLALSKLCQTDALTRAQYQPTRRAHLLRHEKLYKCTLPGCPNKKGFARPDQLERHMRDVRHGDAAWVHSAGGDGR